MKELQYREHRHGGARYLTFPEWERYGELRHLFTTRWGGISTGPCENWNLGFGTGSDRDTPEHREHNVAVLADCLGTTPDRMVWTQQTHTTNIRNVTEADAGRGTVRPRGYTDIDGLVTDCRDIALVTTHADCNPLYFYDPVRHVFGLAHSGWKGTLQGIGRVMIEKMQGDYRGSHRSGGRPPGGATQILSGSLEGEPPAVGGGWNITGTYLVHGALYQGKHPHLLLAPGPERTSRADGRGDDAGGIERSGCLKVRQLQALEKFLFAREGKDFVRGCVEPTVRIPSWVVPPCFKKHLSFGSYYIPTKNWKQKMCFER